MGDGGGDANDDLIRCIIHIVLLLLLLRKYMSLRNVLGFLAGDFYRKYVKTSTRNITKQKTMRRMVNRQLYCINLHAKKKNALFAFDLYEFADYEKSSKNNILQTTTLYKCFIIFH